MPVLLAEPWRAGTTEVWWIAQALRSTAFAPRTAPIRSSSTSK